MAFSHAAAQIQLTFQQNSGTIKLEYSWIICPLDLPTYICEKLQNKWSDQLLQQGDVES